MGRREGQRGARCSESEPQKFRQALGREEKADRYGICAAGEQVIFERNVDVMQGPNKVPREELQRSLGVKPMEKSSRFRGVSRKKGKWEAKVMLNRKWAYRGA